MVFLKQNWFKVGVLVILFAVAVSAVYYFVFFLPREKSLELQQQLDIQKQNQQNALAAEFRKECALTEASNQKDEDNLVNQCSSIDCVKKLEQYYIDNKLIGNSFIQSCVNAKISNQQP